MKKYFFTFLLFIFLVAVTISFYLNTAKIDDGNITWFIYVYFCVLTYLFHLGIVTTTKSRPQVFIRYFMAATTIKLFLHLGIIVFYSLFHKEMAVRFIITFMIMYLLFTGFEVIAVWRKNSIKY